jgi:hypothetical protein
VARVVFCPSLPNLCLRVCQSPHHNREEGWGSVSVLFLLPPPSPLFLYSPSNILTSSPSIFLLSQTIFGRARPPCVCHKDFSLHSYLSFYLSHLFPTFISGYLSLERTFRRLVYCSPRPRSLSPPLSQNRLIPFTYPLTPYVGTTLSTPHDSLSLHPLHILTSSSTQDGNHCEWGQKLER